MIDDILDILLEAVHTRQGDDMSQTGDDDGNADEGCERLGGDVKILEAEEAEDSTNDTQQQESLQSIIAPPW